VADGQAHDPVLRELAGVAEQVQQDPAQLASVRMQRRQPVLAAQPQRVAVGPGCARDAGQHVLGERGELDRLDRQGGLAGSAGRRRNCSGDMYAGVPMKALAWVSYLPTS